MGEVVVSQGSSSTQGAAAQADKGVSGRGDFFAVDQLAWSGVCALGSLNAAVAYLILARGTLRDMRTTAWSVNAIERYTGIARPRAGAAIRLLVEKGFVNQVKAGKRPLYTIENRGTDPVWIWLPGTIVDGAANEIPPVERIRQTQNLAVLRLFVDLYAVQEVVSPGVV